MLSEYDQLWTSSTCEKAYLMRAIDPKHPKAHRWWWYILYFRGLCFLKGHAYRAVGFSFGLSVIPPFGCVGPCPLPSTGKSSPDAFRLADGLSKIDEVENAEAEDADREPPTLPEFDPVVTSVAISAIHRDTIDEESLL
jgi:hypothetical protein